MANFSQRLRHGKALCGKVFAGFVETFNALVDFKDNLKGDADVNGELGHIKVDRTDPSHPILRCKGCQANGGSGSGEEEPEDPDNPGENTECVTSLNDLKGDVTIIGGKGIRVEVQGQTIRLSFDPEKDYEDEDPNAEVTQDPCEHPGSVTEGGVSADDDEQSGSGGGAGGAAAGGVPAEGESHPGDPCNCN